jgi:ABC-type glycerol-3-phosphate transport system permease component
MSASVRLVALPLLGPGLASVAIFNLAAYWSEFCLALVLLEGIFLVLLGPRLWSGRVR